jgi:hypothetical protein
MSCGCNSNPMPVQAGGKRLRKYRGGMWPFSDQQSYQSNNQPGMFDSLTNWFKPKETSYNGTYNPLSSPPPQSSAYPAAQSGGKKRRGRKSRKAGRTHKGRRTRGGKRSRKHH